MSGILPKTYEQVADEMKLEEPVRWRFLVYMANRWPDTEEMKCQTGYAQEWAHRFMNGIEYAASDREGQAVLNRMEGRA